VLFIVKARLGLYWVASSTIFRVGSTDRSAYERGVLVVESKIAALFPVEFEPEE